VLIRDRRATDGPALEAIARQTHALDRYPKYLPDDLESFIADPTALGAWVAEDGGEVVGHVALHTHSVPEVMQALLSATGLDKDDVAVVARLLVAPAARRRGLGRILLERATAEAEALGRRAALDVVDEHTKAIALYEDCGWIRVAQVDWSLPGGRPFHELIYVAPERAPAQPPGTNR
jgi:GNAT superfamily N-acetyltransferase